MTTSDMIRKLCEKKDISISELARQIGQTPQNFSKKLQRGTVNFEELLTIAEVLGITYEQRYILENGENISIGNYRC